MSEFRSAVKKSQEPIWKLEDGLTYSSLSRWLRCREQFVLSVMEGWTPKRISTPLTFGTMFHLCLELQFLSPELTPDQITGIATSHVHKSLSARGALPKEDRDKVAQVKGMITVLFPAYIEYWQWRDEDLEWIERECRFQFNHTVRRYSPRVEGSSAVRDSKDTVVPLRGMRDGAFRDNLGNLFLFETKTKSKIDESVLTGTLRQDFQTLLYCYSLMVEHGECPLGVLYNIVRRPSQKFGAKDTMGSFLSRIKKDVDKRPEHYFLRYNIQLTKEDIATFIRCTLDPMLRSFLDWYETISSDHMQRFESQLHFMNPNALVDQYGKCDLFDLLVREARALYYCRREPFPELAEPKVKIPHRG